MKYLLAVSNLIMLDIAKIFLFFNCTKIPQLIINQCKLNNEFIEKEII